MKNNPLFIVTLIVSLLSPNFVFAQDYSLSPDPENTLTLNLPPIPEPLKNEQNVGEAISPMKKGQTAPFTGLLLSPDAIAKILTEMEYKDQEIALEVQKATEELGVKHGHEMTIAKIKCDSDAKSFQDRVDSQKKEIERLDLELKKEKEDRPNPVVWAAIGVAAGVLTATLTAATIVYVTKQ